MDTIELVIKIPEGIYQHYKKVWQKRKGSIPESCIAFGTPLPKGHGRLIDGDALRELCKAHDIRNSAFDNEPIIATSYDSDGDGIWETLFNHAPTVIEAEKEE